MQSERKAAKLFRNGRSQAVRLPIDFRFEGTEVEIAARHRWAGVRGSSRRSIFVFGRSHLGEIAHLHATEFRLPSMSKYSRAPTFDVFDTVPNEPAIIRQSNTWALMLDDAVGLDTKLYESFVRGTKRIGMILKVPRGGEIVRPGTSGVS